MFIKHPGTDLSALNILVHLILTTSYGKMGQKGPVTCLREKAEIICLQSLVLKNHYIIFHCVV